MIDPPAAQAVPALEAFPPVWFGTENPEDRARFTELLQQVGRGSRGHGPKQRGPVFAGTLRFDATGAVGLFGTDPERTVCIDPLLDIARYRTLDAKSRYPCRYARCRPCAVGPRWRGRQCDQ